MSKFFPITLGIFLGANSIVMGQIHTGVAQFSGMTIIGTHIGYLLGVLIIAWLNWQSWLKSFITGFVTMTFANLTYYLTIIVFYLTGWGRSPFPPSPPHSLRGFILWSIISAVTCVLGATAVWLARHAKHKWLNYGIFAVAYAGMLGVMVNFHLRPAIGWYRMSRGGDFFQTWRFVGRLYEVGFAFVLTTVILGIGLRILLRKHKGGQV